MLRHRPLSLRRPRRRHLALLLTAATSLAGGAALIVAPAGAAARAGTTTSAVKPTVVLVHGAFADASSWTGVITRLQARGYDVVAPADPLRGVAYDASYLQSILATISGPIVLVGHSYGGAVITNAATGNPNVRALVYIAGFEPDAGDSVASLGAQVPGGGLNDHTLHVTTFPTAAGASAPEATINVADFRRLFAADLPAPVAAVMAAAQRPAALQALGEPSGAPAWKSIKSYALIPTKDFAIGTKLLEFMARRAGSTIEEVKGASHAVLVSQPAVTTDLILRAARASR